MSKKNKKKIEKEDLEKIMDKILEDRESDNVIVNRLAMPANEDEKKWLTEKLKKKLIEDGQIEDIPKFLKDLDI